MAKGWMSVALTVSLLGAAASALAQPLPAPPPGAGPQFAANLPPVPVPVAAPGAAPAPPPGAPVMPPAPPPPWGCPPPAVEAPCPPLEPPCDTRPCFTAGFEYLLWFTRKQNLPPLVTTGLTTDPIPGALGQPNTRVLLQGTTGDENQHSGGRLTLGIGVDNDPDWSVDGNFFLLEQTSGSRSFSSPGSPVLTRPFFNVIAGHEDADPVALPSIASGNLQIDTPRRLYGGDINLRYVEWGDPNSRLVFLLGGRVLILDESLRIGETSQDLPAFGVPGNNFFLTEEFATQNRFYGGQIGSEYEFRLGPVSVATTGKVAFGAVEQRINNSAFTRITEPNGVVTTSNTSALYINPDNVGRFSHTRFAVVPEGNVKLGFDFNQYVRLTVGYSFLYLSEAARPGDQVNRNVNVQPVGAAGTIPPPSPVPTIQSASFWAQGLDVGLRFSF